MARDRRSTAAPLVPVSWGDLLDKVTILAIKRERISDARAAANVLEEYSALSAIAAAVLPEPDVAPLVAALREVNEQLWEIEDRIRVLDSERCFDGEFIALARAVYRTNDERAAIKRTINERLGSELVEEKSYIRPAFRFGVE